MNEFNLSSKRFQTEDEFFAEDGQIIYDEKDVKEFIKRLFVHIAETPNISAKNADYILDGLRELAGDKLI